MKKKIKRTLLCIFTALAATFLLVGCTFKQTKEGIINKYDLKASVQYYANGGKFENTRTEKTLWYPENALPYEIGGSVDLEDNQSQGAITNEGYDFDGWFYAELDENGKPVFADEAKTQVKLTDNRFDFSVRLNEGDAFILGAKWSKTAQLEIRLALADGLQIANPDTTSETEWFKNGDVLKTVGFNRNGTLSSPSVPLTLADRSFSFIGYYTDAACTTLVEWPVQKGTTNTVVYARYFAGYWSVVSDPASAKNMFRAINYNTTDGASYWITNDVDMSKESALATFTNFKGVIHSDGATITGAKFEKNSVKENEVVSVFGNIQDGAEIVGVNFKDLTFTCKAGAESFSAYFLFKSLSENAKIENVSVSGKMTLTISKLQNTVIANIPVKGEDPVPENYDSCIFGGYTSDDEYFNQNKNGFKLDCEKAQIVEVKYGV